MPVLCVDKWNVCQSLVEEMLNFLTGDKWKICFRERKLTEIEKKAKKKWEKVTVKNVNISKICMFSGGLDSCIGALNLLCDKEDASDMLFVSHYGGGKGTVEYQGMLKDAFINRFNVDENNFVQNYAAIVTKKEDIKEDSTRSRSFMFFFSCHCICKCYGQRDRTNNTRKWVNLVKYSVGIYKNWNK